MLNERDLRTADLYGFTERVTKLQRELLQIEGVTDVEFDLTGFLSSIPYVIFLPRYDGIPVSLPDYYERRRALLDAAIRVAAENGMTRTEDRIEDYGAHFYIVTRMKEEYYSKPVRYFSIRRPIGPGTFPRTQPVRQIVNYDKREFVTAIEQEAWGYIDFGGALSEEEAYRYELVREWE